MRAHPNSFLSIDAFPDRLRFDRVIMQYSEMDNAGDFTTQVNGTGALVTFNATAGQTYANRFGFAQLQTGSTSTGRAAVATANIDQIVLGSSPHYFASIILTSANLSDATNRYNIVSGFADTLSGANQINGIVFRYRDNLNSGKWQIYSASSSGGSASADTGITVAASTFYKFEIFVDAAGANAYCYINGSLVGTVTSTTIPKGTGEPTGVASFILKAAGTTSRLFHCDYMQFSKEVVR